MSAKYSPSDLPEKENLEVEITVTDSKQPVRKPWLLASIVLIAEVACAVLEGQLTATGFKLSKNESSVEPVDATAGCGATKSGDELLFEAPHFYTFCRFLGRSLAFPILFVGMWIYSTVARRKYSPKEFFRHCSKVAGPGPDGITFVGFVKLFFLPTIFSLLTGAGYIVALVYVAPSITSAIFSSTVAMSYVLSIFFLSHPHLIVKTIFVLVSFGGVGMVAYETTVDEIEPDAWIGIIVVIGASAALSLHQLFYTKSFPNADSFQSAFIVSVIFMVNACIYWPVPLATKLLGAEVWDWNQVPWGYLIGAVTSSLAVAFLYAYGLAVSSPFFMSLGELLNLAVSGLVDFFIRHVCIGPYQWSGFAVIGVSFLILLLPDHMLTIANIRARLSGKKSPAAPAAVPHSESKKNLMSAQSNASLASLASKDVQTFDPTTQL